jgi:hypothetical protein
VDSINISLEKLRNEIIRTEKVSLSEEDEFCLRDGEDLEFITLE